MKKNNRNTKILKEIFLAPSAKKISHRFSNATKAAPCSGKCSSGVCRTVS